MGITKTDVIDITDTTAKVIWETSEDGTTELQFLSKKNPDGSYEAVDINTVTGPGNTGVTTKHIYNLINLIPETVYKVHVKSYDEVNDVNMNYDDPSTPREFATLAAQLQTVGSVSIDATKHQISVGESTDITAKVLDSSGAAMQGINIDFCASGILSWLFFWLPPIGTLNPKTAQTNASGEAKTVFTASRKGIAVIKAKAGSVTNKVIVTII